MSSHPGNRLARLDIRDRVRNIFSYCIMQGIEEYLGLLIGPQLSRGFSARHMTTYTADVFPSPSLLHYWVLHKSKTTSSADKNGFVN